MKKKIPQTGQKIIYDRKAVYVGRRISGNKVYQMFELLPKNEPMVFTGIRGVILGYTYKCTEKTISTRPERTEDELIYNPDWEAKDALVDAHNEKRRSDAKMRRLSKPHLKTAIDSIQPLLKGLHFHDFQPLIGYLTKMAWEQNMKKGRR